MAFSITITGLQEAMSFFNSTPSKISQAVAKAINHASDSVAKYASSKAPRDTGRLQGGIEVTQKATEARLEAVVAPKDQYAIFVEKGTRPHFPPVSALEGWSRRHGIPAFLVARAISRRGTKAQPFMAPAAQVAPQMVATEVNGAISNVLEKS